MFRQKWFHLSLLLMSGLQSRGESGRQGETDQASPKAGRQRGRLEGTFEHLFGVVMAGELSQS